MARGQWESRWMLLVLVGVVGGRGVFPNGSCLFRMTRLRIRLWSELSDRLDAPGTLETRRVWNLIPLGEGGGGEGGGGQFSGLPFSGSGLIV